MHLKTISSLTKYLCYCKILQQNIFKLYHLTPEEQQAIGFIEIK